METQKLKQIKDFSNASLFAAILLFIFGFGAGIVNVILLGFAIILSFLGLMRNKENIKSIRIKCIVSLVIVLSAVILYLIGVPSIVGFISDKITGEKHLQETVQGQKDEITDWKIYRNEEYGLEMKYPKDWIFEEEKRSEEEDVITFHTPEKDKENMYYIDSFDVFIKETIYTDIQKWFNDTYKKNRPSDLVPYEEIITINGNEWLYVNDPVTFGGCLGMSANRIQGSKLYKINEYCGSEMEEILSTLRFLE